jgi:hypothetical protein
MSIAIKYWAFQQSGWGQVTDPPVITPEPEVPAGTADDDFVWIGQPDAKRPPLVFFDRGFITRLRLFTYVKQEIFAQESRITGPTILVYNSTKLSTKDIQLHKLAASFTTKSNPFLREAIVEKLHTLKARAVDPLYIASVRETLALHEYDQQSFTGFENPLIRLPNFLLTKEAQRIFAKGKSLIFPHLYEKSSIIVGTPEEDFLALVLQALAEQGEDISQYDDIDLEIE